MENHLKDHRKICATHTEIKTKKESGNKKMNLTNMNFLKNILSNDADELGQMIKEYSEKLIDKGLMMRRKDLRKKDTIDLRQVLIYEGSKTYEEFCQSRTKDTDTAIAPISPPISEELLKFMISQSWYCLIPCFNEGIIQINKNRYLYYKILNIDTTQNTLELMIQDYSCMRNFWESCTQISMCFDFSNIQNDTNTKELQKQLTNPEKHTAFATIISKMTTNVRTTNEITPEKRYRQIPYDELKWNTHQQHLWENIIIKNASKIEQRNTQKYKRSQTIMLGMLFLQMIVLSNFMLYQHKPKAIRQNKQTQKRITVADKNSTQPQKITRTVGGIRMTSVKPPKLPTQETVIHYKTATWKARGGVRRMKNGKLVPFKECTKHRKCLQHTDTTPQSIIKFK